MANHKDQLHVLDSALELNFNLLNPCSYQLMPLRYYKLQYTDLASKHRINDEDMYNINLDNYTKDVLET